LVEEIRALAMPPIPWEVELGHWFDRNFLPVETVRSWRRLSRRATATPLNPRPIRIPDPEVMEGRTFGVVIDTSGSMGMKLLGKALGTIVSYAVAKKVQFVRVVFCDAAAYDQGWVDVTTLVDRVKVKGFGGTILQPGVDLLERDPRFPKEAPILLITDAECDHFVIGREHAVLIPNGASLPFRCKGEVFRMR
jgi:predicted metal-dependent peptidase